MTTPKIPKDLSCLSGCRLQEVLSNRFETDCRKDSAGYFNCFLNHRKKNSKLSWARKKGECKQRADGETEGFCHFLAVTYRDLILNICYIATCFRDDPEIWQLYKGLSCAEIPAFPNGSCDGDQSQCVIPTPGNLTSACPKKAGKHLPRRVAKRNMRKGHKKKRNKKGRRAGRLVGPSTLHTHERRQAM